MISDWQQVGSEAGESAEESPGEFVGLLGMQLGICVGLWVFGWMTNWGFPGRMSWLIWWRACDPLRVGVISKAEAWTTGWCWSTSRVQRRRICRVPSWGICSVPSGGNCRIPSSKMTWKIHGTVVFYFTDNGWSCANDLTQCSWNCRVSCWGICGVPCWLFCRTPSLGICRVPCWQFCRISSRGMGRRTARSQLGWNLRTLAGHNLQLRLDCHRDQVGESVGFWEGEWLGMSLPHLSGMCNTAPLAWTLSDVFRQMILALCGFWQLGEPPTGCSELENQWGSEQAESLEFKALLASKSFCNCQFVAMWPNFWLVPLVGALLVCDTTSGWKVSMTLEPMTPSLPFKGLQVDWTGVTSLQLTAQQCQTIGWCHNNNQMVKVCCGRQWSVQKRMNCHQFSWFCCFRNYDSENHSSSATCHCNDDMLPVETLSVRCHTIIAVHCDTAPRWFCISNLSSLHLNGMQPSVHCDHHVANQIERHSQQKNTLKIETTDRKATQKLCKKGKLDSAYKDTAFSTTTVDIMLPIMKPFSCCWKRQRLWGWCD